ncbi:uncharacterized protein PHACADRAFT_106801, partial [Phanerochaete carnosa HHB-10118-sp]
LAALRERGAVTDFEWVKGHAESVGNIQADLLAGAGAGLALAHGLDLSYNRRFLLDGAQLSTMTQRLAYRGIRERTVYTPRPRAVASLDMARCAVADVTGRRPSDKLLWVSLQHRDLTKGAREFLWKAFHSAYKVGSYWLNIPNFEHRADCRHCNVPDDMGHILTECGGPCQHLVWTMARRTWEQTGKEWPALSIGVVLGCSDRRCLGRERTDGPLVVSPVFSASWFLGRRT